MPKPVDDLAWHTAGGQVRFRTNAKRLAVRVTLRGPHSMDHMPATGQCGLDCYLGPCGASRFCSTTRFARDLVTYEAAFFADWPGVLRTVTLNLPLCSAIRE